MGTTLVEDEKRTQLAKVSGQLDTLGLGPGRGQGALP